MAYLGGTGLRGAFPDAEVSGYRSLIDGLTCDPKDRHLLAAVGTNWVVSTEGECPPSADGLTA